MSIRSGVTRVLVALLGCGGLSGCGGAVDGGGSRGDGSELGTGGLTSTRKATGDGADSATSGGGSPANGTAIGAGAFTSVPEAVGGGGDRSMVDLGNAFGEIGDASSAATYQRSTLPGPTETSRSCDTTSLTGTIQGAKVDQLYATRSWNWTGVDTIFLEQELDSDGAVILLGVTRDTFTSTPLGTAMYATGALLELPSSIPHTLNPICVGGRSSIERAANHFIVRLVSIGYLPSCDAGTRIDGQIDLCLDGCEQVLTGNIVGGSFDGRNYSASFTDTRLRRLRGTFGHWRLHARYVATSRTAADLDDAWLMDLETGNVYCAGAGSTAEASVVFDDSVGDDDLDPPEYARQLHFRNLKLVGNCSQVSGTDFVEMRTCL